MNTFVDSHATVNFNEKLFMPFNEKLNSMCLTKPIDNNLDFQISKYTTRPKISSLGVYSSRIFELLKLDESSDADIRIFDSLTLDDNNTLYLLHFLGYRSDLYHIRGIIFQIDTLTNDVKMICRSHPYTEEYILPNLSPELELDNDTETTVALDGSIVRLFNVEYGKTKNWFISTHRKINAFCSKWSNTTFGDMFREIWFKSVITKIDESTPEEHFMATQLVLVELLYKYFDRFLDPNRCYVFLISHPENKLVCQVREPKFVLTSVYVREQSGSLIKDNNKIPILCFGPDIYPLRWFNVNTYTQLSEHLNSVNWKDAAGILISNPNYSLKLVSEKYREMKQIRGNQPHVSYRYIQLKLRDESKAMILRDLYQENISLFDLIDIKLLKLSKVIYDLYIRRYRNKEYLTIPQEEYSLLKRIYENYQIDKNIRWNIDNQIKQYNIKRVNTMLQRIK